MGLSPKKFTQKIHRNSSPKKFTQKVHQKSSPKKSTKKVHQKSPPKKSTKKVHQKVQKFVIGIHTIGTKVMQKLKNSKKLR